MDKRSEIAYLCIYCVWEEKLVLGEDKLQLWNMLKRIFYYVFSRTEHDSSDIFLRFE